MTDYLVLLREIAAPRVVGTPHHSRVRELLKREVIGRGFVPMEHRFHARLQLPLWGWRPAEGMNLLAVRPRSRVAVWLVAHYDSKGQPLSMAARLRCAAGCAMAVAVGIGSIVAGAPPLAAVPAVLLAALFVSLNRVHNGSPGAVDNGSGVVTALATVDALSPEFPVGLMFLDAEEWGLRGARGLLRERANLLRDTTVVNFDGIDDRGRPIAFVHRAGPTVERIAGALRARRLRWLPVVVDGLALRRGARECVTIMRGDWGTARVVHTPRDTVDRLTLEGVREVASAVASALRATLQGGNPRVDASVTGV